MFQPNISSQASPKTIRRWLFLAAAFLLTLFAASAHAATYYVSVNGGSDSNPGTEAAPWKTIKYAAAKMNAGDTTYVRGGTYNQDDLIWFRKSGTQSAPIKLLNAPGETPKIHFTDPGRGMILIAAGSGAGYLGPIGWIHVEGFEITNGVVGFRISNAHDLVLRRNWIHHAHSQGILGNGRSVLVDRNVINRIGDFEGCAAGKLHAPGRGGVGTVCNKDHAIYGTGPNWTVTNNLIYDILACGVHVAGYPVLYHGTKRMALDESFAGAANWLIANNTIAYNENCAGVILWQAGTVHNRIINNILYENGQKRSSTNGVAFTNSGGGHIIQNNLCYATAPGATACIGSSGAGKYTASGNIVNTVNPNFEGAGAALSGVPNFKLKAGSPAIDKGLSLPQVTWDHAGGKRPFGAAFDIGAYEHGAPPDSGSPPPNPTGGDFPSGPPAITGPNGEICPSPYLPLQ